MPAAGLRPTCSSSRRVARLRRWSTCQAPGERPSPGTRHGTTTRSPDFDDGSWADGHRPGPLAFRSGLRRLRRTGGVPHDLRRPRPLRTRRRRADGATATTPTAAPGWCSTGVFYTSDVWLDGTYLGDTEGYFFPHQFEVTDTLAGRSEHALAVEVACPRPTDLTRQAQPHRRLPALGPARPGLEPRAASGGRSTSSSRVRSGSATGGCAAAT